VDSNLNNGRYIRVYNDVTKVEVTSIHLQDQDVAVGAVVVPGQPIGKSGASVNADGVEQPHLHLLAIALAVNPALSAQIQPVLSANGLIASISAPTTRGDLNLFTVTIRDSQTGRQTTAEIATRASEVDVLRCYGRGKLVVQGTLGPWKEFLVVDAPSGQTMEACEGTSAQFSTDGRMFRYRERESRRIVTYDLERMNRARTMSPSDGAAFLLKQPDLSSKMRAARLMVAGGVDFDDRVLHDAVLTEAQRLASATAAKAREIASVARPRQPGSLQMLKLQTMRAL